MVDERLVVYSNIRKRMMDLGKRYHRPDLFFWTPSVKLIKDGVDLKQEISGEAIEESLELKLLKEANEFYGDVRNLARFRSFGGNCSLSFETEARKFSVMGHVSKEGKKVFPKEGGVKNYPSPILTLGLETPFVSERDLFFFENFYEKYLPKQTAKNDPLSSLRDLQMKVIEDTSAYSQESLAGYKDVKEQILRRIVFPNLERERLEILRARTHINPSQRSYNCFVFTGPPGTGKTDAGKIVAHQLGYVFVEMQVGSTFEKWYGETPKKIQQTFDLAFQQKRIVLYIDELDKFLGDHKEMHEETARVLSVLLGNMVKATPDKEVVVIASTNYPEMLESALVSRSKYIRFGYPNEEDLKAIFHHYAKHLSDADLGLLAKETQSLKLVGRDILAISEDTESHAIYGKEEIVLPSAQEYLAGVQRFLSEKRGKERKFGFNAR